MVMGISVGYKVLRLKTEIINFFTQVYCVVSSDSTKGNGLTIKSSTCLLIIFVLKKNTKY